MTRWSPNNLVLLLRFESYYYLVVSVGGVRNVGAMVLHGRRSPNSVPAGGQAVGVYFNTPPLAN